MSNNRKRLGNYNAAFSEAPKRQNGFGYVAGQLLGAFLCLAIGALLVALVVWVWGLVL